MFKIYKKLNQVETLWKNGKGKTREICIHPEDSNFQDENFLWRISSASLTSNSQFSTFKNKHRWLIILTEPGILINQKELLSLNPIHFSGEEKIEANLVDGNSILDLGIIYNPIIVKVEMQLLTLNSKTCLPSGQFHHFFYIFQNSKILIANEQLCRGDAFIYENSAPPLILESQNKENIFVYIKISL